MQPLLELMLADNKEIDIPRGSVVMFEEMTEGMNPNFPNAKSFIRYGMGNDLRSAVLATSTKDLAFELDVNVNPMWLRLNLAADGREFCILSKNIVGRRAVDEGCELSLMVGEDVQSYVVSQSRREIKKWTERASAPPEGLISLPVPEGAE